VLLVRVPASVKGSMDDRKITLIGLSIGKEQLNVDIGTIKGVLIQYEE